MQLPVSEELFLLLSYLGESGLRYGADDALDLFDAKSGVIGTRVALVFLELSLVFVELSFTGPLYDDPRDTISFKLIVTKLNKGLLIKP